MAGWGWGAWLVRTLSGPLNNHQHKQSTSEGARERKHGSEREHAMLVSCPINNLYWVTGRFILFAAHKIGESRWGGRETGKLRSQKLSVRA